MVNLNIFSQNDDCKINFTYEVTNVSCFGENNGAIDISINNLKNYSVVWSNGEKTEDIYNLTSGLYTLIISYQDCVLKKEIEVTEPKKQLNAKIIDLKGTSCFEEHDGSISTEAFGGTPPYEFALNEGTVFSSSSLFENLSQGNYLVKIKDRNNCKSDIEVEVTAPTEDEIFIGNSITIVSGEETEIIGPEGYVNYNWSIGDKTQNLKYSLEVDKDTEETISLEVTNENGCVFSSNELTVFIEKQTP